MCVAELCAFVVHPSYRRVGFGDSLLDYTEQQLRQRGFRRVVIIAEQGSYEWFVQVNGDSQAFWLCNTSTSEETDMLPNTRSFPSCHVPAYQLRFASPNHCLLRLSMPCMCVEGLWADPQCI